jgi:hypothetical protein
MTFTQFQNDDKTSSAVIRKFKIIMAAWLQGAIMFLLKCHQRVQLMFLLI